MYENRRGRFDQRNGKKRRQVSEHINYGIIRFRKANRKGIIKL